MQVTLKELLQEIYSELFVTRELVIHTNIFEIIVTIAAIGYLLYTTGKFLTWNHQLQHKHSKYKDGKYDWWVKYNKDAYGPYNKPDPSPKWYPTGWYWDEIDCCWKPPDYPKK